MAMYSAHIVFDRYTVYINPWVSSAMDEDELEDEAIEMLLELYPELTRQQEEQLVKSIQYIEVELQTD
jgi:hypothetical protein